MRDLVTALKEALSHPNADIQFASMNELVERVNAENAYLGLHGLMIRNAGFKFLDQPIALLNHAPSFKAYHQAKKDASALPAPLQDVAVVLSDCLQQQNFPRFCNLLKIIIEVEKNYRRLNISVFSYQLLLDMVIAAKIESAFLKQVIEQLHDVLEREQPHFKEHTILRILNNSQKAAIHPADVAAISSLFDAGANPDYHLENRGTVLDQLLALYANATLDQWKVIDPLCLALIESRLAHKTWFDDGYSAIWYCVRSILTQSDPTEAMEFLPKLIALQQQAPERACTLRYHYYSVPIDDDHQQAEVQGGEFTALYLGLALVAVCRGILYEPQHDDDNLNLRITSLDDAFEPLLQMYATLSMQPGIQFGGNVYPDALSCVIANGKEAYLKSLLLYGAGYNHFFDHVEQVLHHPNLQDKAEKIIDLLVAAHVEFDKRPMNEMIKELAKLEKPLYPDTKPSIEMTDAKCTVYAYRLLCFYEKLLLARGLDVSLKADLSCFPCGKVLHLPIEFANKAKLIRGLAQVSMNYYNYHLDDPTLVSPFLAYLDNNQLIIRSSAINDQFQDFFDWFVNKSKSFAYTEQQMHHLSIASHLNGILFYVTTWNFSSHKNTEVVDLFRKLIKAELQVESPSVIMAFFKELMTRMFGNPKLNLDIKIWRALKEGYSLAVDLEHLHANDPHVQLLATLNEFTHPSLKRTFAPVPAFLPVSNGHGNDQVFDQIDLDSPRVSSSSSSSQTVAPNVTPAFTSARSNPMSLLFASATPASPTKSIMVRKEVELGEMKSADVDPDNQPVAITAGPGPRLDELEDDNASEFKAPGKFFNS